MSNLKFMPDAALRRDVMHFWTLEESPDGYDRNTIIPDSYVELSVLCGAPVYIEIEGAWVDMPPIGLMGLQKTPIRFHATGPCRLISARFYGWTAWPLLDGGTAFPGTSMIALGGRWLDVARAVKQAWHHVGQAEAVAVLQQALLDSRRSKPDSEPVRAAGEKIYAARGQLSIRDLSIDCALSPSQLERSFKHQTGVLPRTFARLVRFKSARNSLMCDPSRSSADLACELGYSDQAHFVHDFKSLAACTPGAYASARRERGTDPEYADFLQYVRTAMA